MNKRGKKIVESILSLAIGFSITTVMQHWFMSGVPDYYITTFDSIIIPLTTVGSYLSLQELKEYIKVAHPEIVEVLSPFFDFEEKKQKQKKGKHNKTKKVYKKVTAQSKSLKENPTKKVQKSSINNIMPEVPTNYFDKLLAMSKEKSVYYSDNNMTKINHFLNFIEYNYLKKEAKTKYIDAIMNQIFIYAQKEGILSFSEADVNNIINNCYFIPSQLKEQIKREYKYCLLEQIKLSYTDYKKRQNITQELPPYTIYENQYYKYLIQKLLDERILTDYKEPEKDLCIRCDLDFLAETVQTVFHEYSYEIVGDGDVREQLALFTSNLIFNAGIEAIKDNSYIISSEAILSGIKSSAYFTGDQKENISRIMLKRMYGVTNDSVKENPKINVKKGNIIPFPGSKDEV